MSVAYVDSSAMVAVRFGEPGAAALARRLDSFVHLISANLLDAEFRAAQAREGEPFDGTLVEGFGWILPDRPLGPELERVIDVGYLKGADLWHVAVALSVVEDPDEITFVTLDERQREVAAKLGFRT